MFFTNLIFMCTAEKIEIYVVNSRWAWFEYGQRYIFNVQINREIND